MNGPEGGTRASGLVGTGQPRGPQLPNHSPARCKSSADPGKAAGSSPASNPSTQQTTAKKGEQSNGHGSYSLDSMSTFNTWETIIDLDR